MLGFQIRVSERVEDMFSAFCRRGTSFLSYLAAVRRRGIGAALSESIALLLEIIAAFKASLAAYNPSITRSSRDNQ